MKTLHTIYTSFAKRVAFILTLLLTIGVTSAWGANVTFERITSTNELTSGAKYLIVYESGTLILNGSSVSSGANTETKSVTISNNTITCDESYAFTITSSSNSWKITGSNGKSIGHSGSSNTLNTGTFTNTISFSSNDVVIGCNSRTLRCNTNNGSPLFRYYKSGQQAIQLYKLKASTFTVTCQSNNSSYGTVSQPSVVTNVANNTAISANGNTLTVGTTTVTATPKAQDANYNYEFTGWTGIPSGNKVTANCTITANFTRTERPLTNYRTTCEEPSTFTVTYDENGATSGSVPTGATEYARDAQVTVLGNTGNLAKTGYTFSGWNTEADGTGTTYAAGDKFTITENTTLYAKWTANTYTITLNTNDGTINSGAISSYTYGVGATLPTDVTKTGYTFAGWYNNSDFTGDPIKTIGTTETGKKDFWAKWTPAVYTINYKDQGDVAFSGTHAEGHPMTHTYNTETTLKSASKDHYTFGGWYKESNCSGTAVTTLGATEYTDEITLYAKWTANTYTITFNAGTGECVTGSVTTTNVGGVTLPTATHTCPDWTFAGWWTEEVSSTNTSPGTLMKAGDAYNPTSDITLYAVYSTQEAGDAFTGYAKVTTAPDDWSGKYLLSTGTYTATGAFDDTGKEGHLVRETYTPSTDEKTEWEFTLAKVDNTGYSILFPDGTWYLGHDDGTYFGRSIDVDNAAYLWTPSTNGISNVNATSRKIADNGSADFRPYSSPSSSNIVYLYKRVGGGSTTIYNSNPTCLVPVWNGATIDKTSFTVNCGETSSTNGAARISFPKETNFNLYKDITVEVTSGNFIIASSRDGEYSTSVTLSPTQNGENVGTFANKYVYVRAVAPPMSSNQLTGTITISGKQITTQVINVTATVTCNEYTLTFNDCGDIKTITDFAGTSVEEMEPWAETCSEPFQYVFDGWATEPVTNGTEEYEKVNFSTFTMPNNNTTILYAVYRYAEEGGEPVNGYVKVTEALADWSGDYVIVNETAKKAIGNAYNNNNNNTLTAIDVAIENDKVVSPSENVIWQIRKSGSWYTMYNATAEKYAYITQNKSEAAGLDNKSQNLSISFNNGIVKIYGETITRCFSYYSTNTEWRTYSTQTYSTGALYRLAEKTIRYTSSLVCGTIEAEDALVTSTKDQKVKVKVPITLESSTGATTINATSDNAAFDVTGLTDVEEGDHTIVIEYTPVEYNITETANITLFATNGATATFTVSGRSLPENFVIATKVGATWYALPANMNGATNPEGIVIDVDETTMTATSPNTTVYTLFPVKTTTGSEDRYAQYGDRVRFSAVNNDYKGLWTSSSESTIRNYAVIDDVKDGSSDASYEWKITTTIVDGHWQYTLQTDQSNNQKYLRYWTAASGGAKWGTYASGNEKLYFLPVTTYTDLDLEVMEWGTNSMVIRAGEDLPQNVNLTINGTTTPKTLQNINGSDLYKIDDVTLTSDDCGTIIIDNGSNARKIIRKPLLVSSNKSGSEYTTSPGRDICAECDIVILNGGKLIADEAKSTGSHVDFANIYVYPGGKLVLDGKSLGVKRQVYLRGGYSWINQTTYDLPEVYVNGDINFNGSGNIIYDYYIQNYKYYQFSLPYQVPLTNVTDEAGVDNFPVWVKHYNGALRAADANATSWEWYYGENFEAGIGYIIAAKPRQEGKVANRPLSIIRFPLGNSVISSAEADKSIATTAHGIDAYNAGTITANNVGWNFIGNPFMATWKGGIGHQQLMKSPDAEHWNGSYHWENNDVKYITVMSPEDGTDYAQYIAANTELKPFFPFYLQETAEGGAGTINFAAANRIQKAPAELYADEPREAFVQVEILTDRVEDQTGVFISDTYSDEIDFDDYEKIFGSSLEKSKLWFMHEDMRMAFEAMTEASAAANIALGYRAPRLGKYTFAINEDVSALNEVVGVYLTDHELGVTDYNLLYNTYEFETKATNYNDQRFTIRIALRDDSNGVVTGVDNIGTMNDGIYKFIYQDKMYIYNDGIIYDATGKQVTNINK